MGLFDDFSFGNPNSMALLGALAGLGQAAAPSRMPVSFGQVLGSLAGGAMQGAGQGYGMRKEELQGELLKAQAAEAQRRAGVLGQFDLNSIFSQTPGQTPISHPTPSAASMPALPGGLGQASQEYIAPPAGIGGALPRAAAQFAQQHGVDPAFYTSVIDAESGFNPLARNPTTVKGENATGIAQFMPSTAKQYGVDPLNAGQALEGGARYFADLLKQHDGDYIKAAQSYGTLPKSLENLNPKQQKVLQVAQALNSGGTFTDAAPAVGGAQSSPMAVAPGAAAMNIDPLALAKQRAVLGLGGISGDPLSGFAQAYYNSPQYKAATAAAEKWATVSPSLYQAYAGPEANPALQGKIAAERARGLYAGPEADPTLQGNIAGARAEKTLPYNELQDLFKGQVAAAQAANSPLNLTPGMKTILPRGFDWPTIPGFDENGRPSAAGGAAASGPVTLQGTNPNFQKGVELSISADQDRIAKDLQANSDKASDVMATSQLIGDLLPRVATGWGGETKLDAARIMKGLGVSDDAVKSFLGTDAAAGDVLQKQFLAQTAQAVRVMGAREPGSVISLFGKAYPSLATQPNATKLMENVLFMQGQRAKDEFAMAQQQHTESVDAIGKGQDYVPLSKFTSEFDHGLHSSINYLKGAQAMSHDQAAWRGLKPDQIEQIVSLIPSGRSFLAPDGTVRVKP